MKKVSTLAFLSAFKVSSGDKLCLENTAVIPVRCTGDDGGDLPQEQETVLF